MTLIPVSRISALVDKAVKAGDFLWIACLSLVLIFGVPSIVFPRTLNICPSTSGPTGTVIASPVLVTRSHLLSPSVESMAIPLTTPVVGLMDPIAGNWLLHIPPVDVAVSVTVLPSHT